MNQLGSKKTENYKKRFRLKNSGGNSSSDCIGAHAVSDVDYFFNQVF